jgi:hypothetical protein
MSTGIDKGGYDEAWLRDLIFTHPEAIPVHELDPAYGPLIPICKELDTRSAGFVDALFVNPLGMPTLLECKLWRNPEARREVVGQILDYARTLRRWTFSDLQREAARARKEQGFDLSDYVRKQSGINFDSGAFIDNITRNLQKGRVLLLVFGDGIREGVEAIADYLRGTTSLQFTFGLVEAQAFELGHETWIIQSRIVARTTIINRAVVDVIAPGVNVIDAEDDPQFEDQRQPDERQKWMLRFWTELLGSLKLDDREQLPAKPLAESNIFFSLPAYGNVWLTCYFDSRKNEAGVFLGYNVTSQSAVEVIKRIESNRDSVNTEIESSGLKLSWLKKPNGKLQIGSSFNVPNIRDEQYRKKQLEWFSKAINTFVNVFRPRVAAAWQDLTSD